MIHKVQFFVLLEILTWIAVTIRFLSWPNVRCLVYNINFLAMLTGILNKTLWKGRSFMWTDDFYFWKSPHYSKQNIDNIHNLSIHSSTAWLFQICIILEICSFCWISLFSVNSSIKLGIQDTLFLLRRNNTKMPNLIVFSFQQKK